jgi:hypothetical protein
MSTPVTASQPISFSLLNLDDQPVLEILDDVDGQDLKLEITNSSRRDLQIKQLTAPAGPANHHFELRFRPGVLNTKAKTTVDGDWSISKPEESNGVVSFFLLHTKGQTLRSGETAGLMLHHVAADGRGGARGTRVELRYVNKTFQYVSDGSQPAELLANGQREQYLSIVNQRGRKYIPLHVSFAGSNTVLNDGHTANDRILTITNLLKNAQIPLTTTDPAITRFILSFDVYDPGKKNEWALGDGASVNNIQVEVLGANWNVSKGNQGQSPEWIITPKKNKTALEPEETIQLRISKIVSSMRSGAANVYLRYENISGYWDGQFITGLEKTHLIQRDQLKEDGSYTQESYVGIGTDDPKSHLDVNGVANIWSGEHYAASNGRMKPGSLTIGSCSASYGGSTRRWEDNNVAGLLLETVNNTEIAVHNHNKRLASLMYYEGGEVNRISIGRNMGVDALSTLAINGNVGIGTADPKSKLHVSGNSQFDGNVGIGKTPHATVSLDVNGDIQIPGGSKINLVGDDHHHGLRYCHDSLKKELIDGPVLYGWGGGGLAFCGPAEADQKEADPKIVLRWSNTGKVGIGTTDPQTALDIRSNDSDCGMLRVRNTGATAGEASIGFFDTKDQTAADGAWASGVGGWGKTGDFVIGTAGGAGGVKLLIDKSGNVGIGTDTPGKGKLEINGTASGKKPGFTFKKWLSIDGLHTGGDENQALSIYASGDIGVSAVFAFSDERIKQIQGRSDSSADLQTLLGIEVTDFHYKDVIARGNAPHKKAIAQQVEKVFPEAVTKSTDVVPDIYQKARIENGWVVLTTDLKKGDRVRLIGEKQEGVYEVLETAAGKFRTGFAPDGDQVFVFGREVNDYRSVDYDAIAMLNVSATQQLKKEKDEEVKALGAEIAELKAANDALRRTLQLLESRLETVPSVGAATNSNVNGSQQTISSEVRGQNGRRK